MSEINHQTLIKYILHDNNKGVVNCLKYIDPSENNNEAILLAIKKDRKKIFKTLYNDPRVDVSHLYDSDEYLLTRFSETDSTFFGSIIKILIVDPCIDVSNHNNCALIQGICYNNYTAIKL